MHADGESISRIRGWILTRSATPPTALDHKQNCSVHVSIPLVPRDFDGNPTAWGVGISSLINGLRCCTSRQNSGLSREIDFMQDLIGDAVGRIIEETTENWEAYRSSGLEQQLTFTEFASVRNEITERQRWTKRQMAAFER